MTRANFIVASFATALAGKSLAPLLSSSTAGQVVLTTLLAAWAFLILGAIVARDD